ncbi:MAG: transposase [Bdellovibrionota bacterium]
MRQLALPIRGPHGGRRRGAGRPNLSGLQSHGRRSKLSGREPVHVTLKLAPDLPSLKRKDIFACLRSAVGTARGKGFGVVHFAVLANHVHLILEPGRNGPSKALQSLQISFARRINGIFRRKGPVFRDRYHLHVLNSPREVRNALAYVLTNEEKHRGRGHASVRITPFTSGYAFRGWRQLGLQAQLTNWSEDLIEAWLSEILVPARTWLLREGWKRAK